MNIHELSLRCSRIRDVSLRMCSSQAVVIQQQQQQRRQRWVRWASESDSLSSIMAEQSDSPAAVQTPQPALTTSWPIVKEAYELQEVIGGYLQMDLSPSVAAVCWFGLGLPAFFPYALADDSNAMRIWQVKLPIICFEAIRCNVMLRTECVLWVMMMLHWDVRMFNAKVARVGKVIFGQKKKKKSGTKFQWFEVDA